MQASFTARIASIPTAAGSITSDDVDLVWSAITGGDADLDSERDTFALLVHEQLAPESDSLEFGLGAWQLDLRTAAAQAALCGSAVATLLVAAHVTDLSSAVIPTVVPLLFNVTAVRLDRDGEALLLDLQRRVHDDGVERTPDQLYAALPGRVRKRISKAQFELFLHDLVEAGAADQHAGQRYRIRSATRPAFLRITIR